MTMRHQQDKTNAKRKKRPRILLVGSIFPKGGGFGMVKKILLESMMNADFEIDLLDTG